MGSEMCIRDSTYDIKLPDDINEYCNNMRKFPPLAQWIREAEAEDWTLPSAEIDVSKL